MASVVENRRPLFFVDLRFVDLWGGRGRPPGQPARRRRYSIVLASTLFHSFGVTMLRSVVLAFLLFCTISAHAAEAPWAEIVQKSRNARTTLRSEEHTSELQSRENLVCRLLLEKKKNK